MFKVDLDSQSSRRPAIFSNIKEVWGYDRTLNIITFRTETSKAATQTACRGLGIDVDTARELSSLITVTRGKVASIKECIEGNEAEGIAPNKEFVNRVSQFPGLLETIKEIEGLVSGRGSHASGLYLFDKQYIEQNSMMKAPNGMEVTCWEQADSDATGALKVDELVTECLDKIRKCMNFLLDAGEIKWQGSLRKTYDTYFSPDVINYTNREMWKEAGEGKIYNLFQFDTQVGSQSIKKIQPKTLQELALSSSVMRLMANDHIDPIERFVAYKNNISLWYKEMQEFGLNQDEVHTLEKYLKRNYGNSIEQEDVMELSMDEHIAGFDIVEANKLRKAIAKKKKKLMEQAHELFYSKGASLGTRKVMLDYVWEYCVKPQLGYSFS